jgi:hypothetical protein
MLRPLPAMPAAPQPCPLSVLLAAAGAYLTTLFTKSALLGGALPLSVLAAWLAPAARCAASRRSLMATQFIAGPRSMCLSPAKTPYVKLS